MKDSLRYPIGEFRKPESASAAEINGWIDDIAQFPASMHAAVEGLTDQQLDTPYRPDGWTIRQVVNHCADSHMNCLTRMKLALTEDMPVIKPYLEARWAELADTKTMPVGPALAMLDGVHARLATLLRSMTMQDFNRGFVHPERGDTLYLYQNLSLYSWHCHHHLAHITRLKDRMGWNG